MAPKMYFLLASSFLLVSVCVNGNVLRSPFEDFSFAANPNLNDGNAARTMADYVIPYGYPLEEHDVVTEDGYILGIYRIPHGRNQTSNNRTPVIVQHGLMASSACFVTYTPDKALGFVLAEAGFDVWLSNCRGNSYSKGHVKLHPVKDSKQFYDYSFHEMGYYDLPALIDYVLEKTNNSQVYYVGHSEGTTEFFAMAAARPEYNAKIKQAAALATVAFMENTRGLLKFLSHFSGALDILLNMFNVDVLLKGISMEEPKFPLSIIADKISEQMVFLTSGFDYEQLDMSMLPAMMKEGSAGVSVKQLRHYSQLMNSHKFAMYDYGEEENMKRYNQTTPLEYDLSKITARVNLHTGPNDYISTVPDVQKLNGLTPNSVMVLVNSPVFNHMDFLFAKDINTLLHEPLIKLFKS